MSAPTPALLAAKFHRPAAPRHAVPRPALIARLNDGLAAGRPLTLIAAPAGYGKTTLAAEWVAGLGRPVAWLALDEADDDPLRFCTYFVAALQRVHPAIGAKLLPALLGEGLTYAEIAERLVVSLNTVRFHVKEIYGKLGVNRQAQAVARAREVGLV